MHLQNQNNFIFIKQMKLLLIFTTLLFSTFLTPCVALHQVQYRSFHVEFEKDATVDGVYSLPSLPRKLRALLDEEPISPAKVLGGQVSTSNNNHKENIAEKAYHRSENVVDRSRGTRQEWINEEDDSKFFTMDYSKVKRRRPIHNKSLPVGP